MHLIVSLIPYAPLQFRYVPKDILLPLLLLLPVRYLLDFSQYGLLTIAPDPSGLGDSPRCTFERSFHTGSRKEQ